MNSDDLTSLVREIQRTKCERQNIEVKKAEKGTPKRLYDTFSSFANQRGGGTIVFGIDEDQGFILTGVHNPQDLQKDVTNQALQMEPVVRPVFTVAEIDGKVIVSAEVAECDDFDKPCYYRGVGKMKASYVRVGDADIPMTDYEVYSYEVFKRKIQDELRPVERAGKDSFDKERLGEYFSALRRTKPLLANQSEEKILQLQGITDRGIPTVAGIMLFGEYPQAYFPQLSVTAVSVDGYEIGNSLSDTARFIDNQRFEGGIPRMLEDSMSFVRRNTKTATIINEDGRRSDRNEYPMIAVREIVLNALIHRDYSLHTENSPVRIMIFKDRLEVENPGGLYGRMTMEELGKTAGDTRNPFIAGALEVIKITENRFSGIPTIKSEMEKAGLPEPVFASVHGCFKVTLYNKSVGFAAVADVAFDGISEKLLDFCFVPRSREEIAAFVGVKTVFYAVEHYIKPLLLSGKLRMT
ncbi:MAG: putative DNA binding domain-containing protein, partial [Treponema sp.]|nr:putative DNA binding domain-containing protein [Treponema sp.]